MVTDEQALLRAILLNPGDDLARIVLADWLEEHAGTQTCPECGGSEQDNTGEKWCSRCGGTGVASDGRADRAEFIRVQIAIEETKRRAMWVPTEPMLERHPIESLQMLFQVNNHDRESKLDALRRRATEMQSTPGCRWWGDYGPGGEYVVTEWTRGFASSVAMTLASFERHAEAIFRLQPVETVRLTDKSRFRYDGSNLRVWYRESGDPLETHAEQSRLPDHVFDALGSFVEGGHREGRWKTYDGDAAANAALSAALVLIGRTRAGLV